MSTLEFIGLVKDGKLPDAVRVQIGDAVKQFDGKRVSVVIKEVKRRRSSNQNGYYFGCVIPPIVAMLRAYGNDVDADDVHDYLKQEVGKLNRIVVLPDGEVKKVLGSTRNLTTLEFEAYLEKCRAFAAEHGVEIKLPNEL